MRVIKELVQSNRDGKTSTTKFWYNIACFVAVYVVCWYAYNLRLTWEMFGIFLISVGGFSSLSKFLNLRFKAAEEPSNQGE